MSSSITTISESLSLELISKEHMAKTYEWICDPEFRKAFLMRGESNWSRHVAYFENLINDPTQRAFAIFWEKVHVGNCGFKYIDCAQNYAELWIYIGGTEARGEGIGTQALRALLAKGECQLQLSTVDVHVEKTNYPAIRLYERHAFVEYGACSEEWRQRQADVMRMRRVSP